MPNKFLSAIRLARLNIPASYLLPFYIASLGGILASKSLSDLKIIPLFFIGSIVARGAGCIVNDIFDKDFDAKVERTKNRPLADHSVSLNFAITQLLIFMVISFCIMLLLNKTAIMLSLIAAIMIALYPLMKRITYLPQVFLGLTYNMGALIGYASIADKITLQAIILYLSIGFWTIGFDTIYGYMDMRDDKKINVKSLSILLENKHYKVWIGNFYILFVVLIATAYFLSAKNITSSLFFVSGITIAILILSWQIFTLDINNHDNCSLRFRSNNYVGLILTITSFMSKNMDYL